MAGKKRKPSNQTNGANLGFEAALWAAADKLRSHMDAAEYKHVVLGLLFLKYVSDAFEEKHLALLAEKTHGADPEDPGGRAGAGGLRLRPRRGTCPGAARRPGFRAGGLHSPRAEAVRSRARKELGEEIELLHDVHERVSPTQTLQFCRDVERFRLFFEDPGGSPQW